MFLGLALAAAIMPVLAQASQTDPETVVFSLTAFGEWHDNRNNVSGDTPEEPVEGMEYGKQDAIKLGIGPGIRIQRRSGNTEFSLGYYPMYQWWDDAEVGQVESELTHDASATLRYRSAERLDLSLVDTLKYNDDPDLYLGEGLDFPEDTDRRLRTSNSHFENEASAGLRYRLRQRVFMTLDGSWRIRRYDEEEIARRGDEDEMGVSLGLSYQQTPFLSYGLFASHNLFDRESDVLLESGEEMPMGLDWTSVGLSASYRLSEGATLTGRYGYQYVRYENDDIDDREYPTDAQVELRYEPFRRAQLILGGRLTVQEGYDYPYVDQELRAVYASLAYHHTARLTSTCRAEYRSSEYEEQYTHPTTPDGSFRSEAAEKPSGGRDGTRNDLFLRVGLNFRWNEKLTLSGYYSFEDVDSEVSDSYSANIVGARASYRF